MRLAARAVLILPAAIALAVLALLAVAHPRWSIDVLAGDDAGYYFAIARNLLLGHGFSFDRVHETNGFNPLQSMILIAAFHLLAPGLAVPLTYRVGVLSSWLAFVVAAIPYARLVDGFLDRDVRGDVRRLAVGAALTFYAGFVALKNVYGQDGPLVLLIGGAWLVRTLTRGMAAPGVGAAMVDGGLLAALFLARVDSLPFLAAAYGLMTIAALRRPEVRRPLLLRVLATAALMAPYFAWNLATFGMWLPISARIKSSFPAASLARSLEVIRGTSLNPADQASFLLAFAFAAAVVVRHLASRSRWDVPLVGRGAVLQVLALYLLGRLGYMAFFSRSDVQGSYVMLAHVFNVLVAIRAASWLARRAGGRALVAASGLLLGLALGLLAMKGAAIAARWRALVPGGAGDDTALAAALHARTGSGDVLYGSAFGMLGFLTDRPWINGDGVANTLEYQRALRDDRLEPWLAANGVTHVAYLRDPAQPGPLRTLDVHSGLYDVDGRMTIDERRLVLSWRSLRGAGAEVRVAGWSPDAASATAPATAPGTAPGTRPPGAP